MATDFFERQAAARKSSGWLILMFVVALLALVTTTTSIAYVVMSSNFDASASRSQRQALWQVPLGVAGATALLIGGGSLFKIAALRLGGGRGVAEGLGGKPVTADTRDPDERRLLNVVEEMAIASGTPVPPVFLMDEEGINAFAAGYTPSDAVIGVTRGAVHSLDRAELQGVIAHEFSHILNGDMRMSIRLIGVLHGILLLGLIGRIVLRALFESGTHIDSRRGGGDDSGKGGAAILAVIAVAIALVVIGSVGSLIGGLIKAAVSRQREYLADASAVQFTRNPLGIAGALKRIGASIRSSRLSHPRAPELSHMYFSQGVWEGFTGLMATHPPLEKRIIALDPAWDGDWGESVGSQRETGVTASPAASGFSGDASNESLMIAVDNAVEQVGEPMEAHRAYAANLLASIPERVAESAREPYGARAVVYALLLDEEPAVRRVQQECLADIAEPDVVALVQAILPDVDNLDARTRLPLIDLALPALGSLSSSQYIRFDRAFRVLVAADQRLSMFEWVLSQVLTRHLRPKYEPVRSPRISHYSLKRMQEPCSIVLSALAWSGHADGDPRQAFREAARLLPEVDLRFLSRERCGLNDLRQSLDRLTGVAAKHRGRLIDAAAEAICADGRVSIAEAELLRGVSDLLDCPMPPLLPGQKTAA